MSKTSWSHKTCRKRAEKHRQGTLRLNYNTPNFLQDLKRFFQKWRSLWGLEGVFINLFVYMLHRRLHLQGNNGAPSIDANGHMIFEFFFVSAAAYYPWTGVTSSSYCRTRHSQVESLFFVREVHVLLKIRAGLSKPVTLWNGVTWSLFGSMLGKNSITINPVSPVYSLRELFGFFSLFRGNTYCFISWIRFKHIFFMWFLRESVYPNFSLKKRQILDKLMLELLLMLAYFR